MGRLIEKARRSTGLTTRSQAFGATPELLTTTAASDMTEETDSCINSHSEFRNENKKRWQQSLEE